MGTLYYIKGNSERGDEVIKLLESKGGKNICGYTGTDEDYYYYIDKNNAIRSSCADDAKYTIINFCEELTLPDKTWEPKFKIGDYVTVSVWEKATAVITGINLEKKLYTIKYIIEGDIHITTFFEDKLTLWQPKRGETVLVRNYYDCPWNEAIFSYLCNTNNYPYTVVGGNSWSFCIPFDEDKLGQITKD